MASIPTKMKSVFFTENGVIKYGADTIDVPVPRPGQVLIKIESSVINPSDIYYMEGLY